MLHSFFQFLKLFYQAIKLLIDSCGVVDPNDALEKLVIQSGGVLKIRDNHHEDVCHNAHIGSRFHFIFTLTLLNFSPKPETFYLVDSCLTILFTYQ